MKGLGGSVRSLAVLLLVGWVTGAPATGSAAPRIEVRPVRGQQRQLDAAANDKAIAAARAEVAKSPKSRAARFALVLALQKAGQTAEALKEALAWRRRDAYNLLAVRMVGDLHAELGHHREAMRAWSAVVELLPEDASAHRALASALKQAGEIKAACARLRRAVDLHHDDHRLRFELGDCLQRTGRLKEAEALLAAIVADKTTPALVLGPSQQRLAQLWSEMARNATLAGRHSAADLLRAKRAKLTVPGGLTGDIKVYLSWDTDRSDIDLWVTNPQGHRVWYRARKGPLGGQLFGDVTTGYGPEMFIAPQAGKGTYKVEVNYFGTSRRGLREARGEVVIVTNAGTPSERRIALPYRLLHPKQTVTVAEIQVR